MRTDEDLKAAFTTLADRAPTPDQVGFEIPGEPRRRRPARLPVLVSVTATVVAAVAVPVVLGRGTAEAPVQANDTWHYSFDVDLPAGFVIVDRLILRDFQHALVTGPQTAFCEVSVFAPGAFDSSGIPPGSTEVTVRGRPGYFGTFGYKARSQPGDPGSPSPRIAWRYDADSWAVVGCSGDPGLGGTRELEQTIANGVLIERSPFTVPFRIGHLPARFITESADYSPPSAGRQPDTMPGVNTHAGVHLARAGDPYGRSKGHSIPISFRRGPWSTAPSGSRAITVNDRPAWIHTDDNNVTTVVVRGSGYEVAVISPNDVVGVDEQEVLRIAEGLVLAADPLDESTWFDGTVAIP